tara:strand:+ start:2332 stop:2649 length:318 start_codon:yes stop_codon:yes gene_type:complete
VLTSDFNPVIIEGNLREGIKMKLKRIFKAGQLARIFDWASKGDDHPHTIPGHKKIVTIVRPSTPEDKNRDGEEIGDRAADCYLVAGDFEGSPTHYHVEWLDRRGI